MQSRPKQLITALLSLTLLLLPALGSAAEMPTKPMPPMSGADADAGVAPRITRDEAVQIARSMFVIPADMGEPNVGLNQSREGTFWNVNWETRSKQAEWYSINVIVDALGGFVTSYSRWGPPTENAAPLTYTRSEAQQLAQQWLQKLAGDLMESLRLRETPLDAGWYGGGAASYDFHWERMHLGYPLHYQGVTISIDSRSGQLMRFDRPARLPVGLALPEAILDAEAARAAFATLPMGLYYQRFHKPGTNESEWRLVYRPMVGLPLVNHQGQLTSYSGELIDPDYMSRIERVPVGAKPYQKPAQPLSEQEALALAQSVMGITQAPTYSHYSEYGEEVKSLTWEFNWEATGTEKERRESRSGHVRVDAERGLVLSYYTYGMYSDREKVEPLFTEEQARMIGVAFLQSHRPDLAGNVLLMPAETAVIQKYEMAGIKRSSYSVRFQHLHNGIPLTDMWTNIEVDAVTGRVTHMYSDDQRMAAQKLPAAGGEIGNEAAAEALLTHMGLELAWVTIWPPYEFAKAGQMPKPETRLLWAPGRAMSVQFIDALTGVPLDWEGRNLIEAMKRPADIEGHFAQREIELLWARRILELQDGKFNPDQAATAGELSRWLVLSRGLRPYVSYDFRAAFSSRGAGGEAIATKLALSADNAYIGAAFQAGIIQAEDFSGDSDPGAPVSRELFALWAVRAMGYGPIANMPNRIEMPFVDQLLIGEKYANAVAVLHGLGVIGEGKAGFFEPQRHLTRGEAAQILFAVSSEVRR